MFGRYNQNGTSSYVEDSLKLKTIRDDTSRLTSPTFDFSGARRAALSKP